MNRFKKVGKVYGKLLVKEYLGNLNYRCVCDCGKECIIRTTNLRKDKRGTFSCEDCRKKEKDNKENKGRKVGMVFGEVKVLKYIGNSNYLCHCNRCDNDFITKTYNLREGRRGIKTCGCNCLHYEKDEEFFDEINTEEKAYILGLIASDGHVNLKNNNLKLTLNYKDYELVEKFAKTLKYNGPINIKDTETTLPNGKTCKSKVAEVVICSKKLVSRLTELGFDNIKTYTLDFDFNIIPSDLLRHFLRGYFDGDGTCNITRGSSGKINYHICCSGRTVMMENLKRKFEEIFPDIKINIYVPIKNRPWTSTIYYNKKKGFKKFVDYLYKNSKIYLYRKYKTYKENLVILDMMEIIDNKKGVKKYKNIPIENKKELYKDKRYKEFLKDVGSNDYPIWEYISGENPDLEAPHAFN